MNFTATITSVNGIIRGIFPLESVQYEAELNGEASATFTVCASLFDASVCPWDRISIVFNDQPVWHGFVGSITHRPPCVVIKGQGIASYLRRKLILDDTFFTGPLGAGLQFFWQMVNARHETNIALNTTASTPITLSPQLGTSIFQLLTDSAALGYEWYYNGSQIVFMNTLGSNLNQHDITYHFASSEGSTALCPTEATTDGRTAYTTVAVLGDGLSSAFSGAAVPPEKDDMMVAVRVQGDAPTVLLRQADGYRKVYAQMPLNVELNPRRVLPGEYELGDAAAINITTGYAPLDVNRATRIAKIAVAATDGTLCQTLTLADGPLGTSNLASRVAALEPLLGT